MKTHKRKLAAMIGTALLLSGQGFAVQAAPESVELTLLGTTDVHGHVYPTTYYTDKDEALGLAKVHTLIKQYRAKNPHTLLVDSGDMLQGSPLPYVQAKVHNDRGPNPMIQAMNAMKYDVFGVGNHEFNFGIPHLKQAEKEAQFPFVSCNIYYTGTDKTLFKPYVIKEVAGVKVGILGFTPPGIVLWDKDNIKGTLEARDLIVSAKRWVPEIKAKGADIVLAIPHAGLGGSYVPAYTGYSPSSGLPPENVAIELAKQVPGLDLIFAGHSHQDVPSEVVNGVAIAQASLWGKRLVVGDVKLTKHDGRWQVVSKATTTLGVDGVTPDPEVLEATKVAHDATVKYVHSPIARTNSEWSAKESVIKDTPILDLINEVQRKATGAQLASAASFNLDAVLAKGNITIADIAGLYPYENNMVAIKLNGKKLKQYLEFSAHYYLPFDGGPVKINPEVRTYNYDMVSGVDYKIDLSKPLGSRIVGLSYKGKPVKDNQEFTMALNSYRHSGGGGYEMLKDCPVVYDRQESIRELIIDYLKTKKTIQPKDVFKANWELLPAAAAKLP
ncbi:5'-nucleotidase C-terminal domain-containing protein [bacterium]|nr:5'-nucleotidase C-terminal domain-containing protein [bacterium]